MTIITAGDLTTKSISTIERLLRHAEEVVISVRGKPRYVVMELARYDDLRECEIAAAWAQTRADVAGEGYRREGADAHIARIQAELTDML